jgi:hypothetical protein
MLYEFQDKVYLEYKQWWFVWESAWEGFRPIEGVMWTGTAFQIQDLSFCSDPTSELYGYGSEKMRELCMLLSDIQTTDTIKVSTLPFGTEWFRDRFVAFTLCAPRDVKSWKRMVKNKPRTCRKEPRGKKLTRRIHG